MLKFAEVQLNELETRVMNNLPLQWVEQGQKLLTDLSPERCNNIPRDIPEREPQCTYILCENRSSIQGLALMRLAISFPPHIIVHAHALAIL